MWSIAQQTKACRRLYNANSKNRGGLRGLRREETRGIVKRGCGRRRRRVAVTVKKQCGRACGYFKFAWHHRAQQPLRAPSVPFDFAPYVSSHRVSPRSSPFSALICIRPIMSSDSPSHPRRRTSRPSIKPRLFLLQLTPFPHLATRIGRLHAEDCSLVTTPHVHLLRAHTDFVWPLSSRESR